MKNALRFGTVAATAAVIGLAGHSAKSEESGEVPVYDSEKAIAWNRAALIGLIKLIDMLNEAEKQRDATRAQLDEVLMRLDTMEQACENATQEDGCPAGCKQSVPSPIDCLGPWC